MILIDVPVPESAALTTALKAFATLTREQKSALSRALDGFVDCLVAQTNPNVRAGEVIQEKSWHNRVNWDEKEWLTWETWGWYRHFCRLVSPAIEVSTYQLCSLSLTVLTVFAQLCPNPWLCGFR